MFHVGALAIIGGRHARGGTVVLQQQFDAADAVHLIAAERITLLHLAPVMLNSLLDALTESDATESLRTVISSAAPMSAVTLQRALAVFPDVGFLNLYGQTEVIVSGLPREIRDLDNPHAEQRLRSVGFPSPARASASSVTTDVKYPPVTRARSSSSPIRRSAAISTTPLRPCRHCGTGGVAPATWAASTSAGCCIWWTARRTSSSAAARTSTHPRSRMHSVCSREWRRAQSWERPTISGARWCAVVVPSAGWVPTLPALQALQDGVRRTLARYKVPRRLVLVTELPVLASGKVDKKRLRAELADPKA